MKRKDIIRVGDIVKVINPEFFIRCGYNLCLKDVTEKIINERAEEIEQFIDKFFGIDRLSEKFMFICQEQITDTGKEIAKALAYRKIREDNFGGKERKIFTERKEELINTEFRVCGIKIHKTGTYYPADGGYSGYDGEYDYEPGGLENEKTHKILEIFPTYTNSHFASKLATYLFIEAIHVEKIFTEEEY